MEVLHISHIDIDILALGVSMGNKTGLIINTNSLIKPSVVRFLLG